MTTWNSALYTGQIGSAGASANAASGFPLAQIESGKLRYATVAYALNGNESANDIINICTLKAGSKVIPSLCRIVCEDPGTALTVSIGDTTTAARYANAVALTTAHDVAFTAGTAVANQYVPTAIEAGNEVIKCKTTTTTALTAGAKILFQIAYLEP